MRRTHLTMHGATRRGQALMVAVLLMMAILLVGILFVALVTYNQEQSTRHENLLEAQAMAEAGVRYATWMLENSPEGADWRPPAPPPIDVTGSADPAVYGPDATPGTEDDYYTDMEIARGWAPVVTDLATRDSYNTPDDMGFTRYPNPLHPASTTITGGPTTIGGGYFFLRVSYNPWEPGDPGTPDPLNWHIKIESIGRVAGTEVYRKLVAYKPIPMLNYARLVHDATDHGQPAFFGVPAFSDMDQDGNIAASGDVRPDWLPTTIDGPVKVNGKLRVAGGNWWDGSGSTEAENIEDASTTFLLTDGLSANGYPRQDKIEVSGGIYRFQEPADTEDDTGDRPAKVIINGGTPEYLHYTSDDADPDADSFDTMNGHVLDGQQSVSATGDSRFVDRVDVGTLTLGNGTTGFDRYRTLTRQSGQLVRESGTGPFVNNGEWGYGRGIYIDNSEDIQFDHDIQALIDDWQRPATAATPMGDSGWNALYTTYAPPAVKIEFLPEELPVGEYVTGTDPSSVGSGQVWWPYHETGQPGIKITRYDETWRIPEGANAGEDSGLSTIVLDYPTSWLDGSDDTVRYPVIVAEGNVRVTGQLPPALNAAGDMTRSYDMTVVSGGTIYIDGQLLAPNDYLPTGSEVADGFNSKVALLARDNVCLNATQIVPQDTVGAAPAVPDDPLNPADPNKHWELSPGSDGRGYSLFYWGEEPAENNSAALVVRQTAADPGPSGVALTPWDENTGYTAYVFGDAPEPMVDETFALVPEGTLFPEAPVVGPPQPYGVAAIAPEWAPYRDAAAQLPWDLAGYVDPTPGLKNAIVLQHADPHLGAGSTSYWLKRWKIAEYNDAGLPVGAINARVNAAVFAERGCWYVLTPGYFDDGLTVESVRQDEPSLTLEEARARVVENRRYNYRLTFIGTIAENFTASVEAAQDWHNKMAYPETYDGGELDTWGTVNYIFDETLRMVRFHSTVSNPTNPAANLPRLPLLPVSPDMVYYGE